MPTIKIGRRSIAKLAQVPKPTIYYDSDLAGFGLLVRPTGSRSWTVEYRPGAGGRGTAKRRLVIGNPASMTPEAARAAAKDILARAALGQDPAGERTASRRAATVAEIASRWLVEHVEAKRKPRTAASYRAIVHLHLVPRIGARRAVELTRADVSRLHNEIAAGKIRATAATGGRARGGQTIANRSINALAAMLSWAAGMGLVAEGMNPCNRVERFREQGRERFLSTEELERLGVALREAETVGLPWKINETKKMKHVAKRERRHVFPRHVTGAVRLLLLTGCRLREILHLLWEDVDVLRGLLHLPESKTGRRVVYLSAPALAVLDGIPRHGRYVVAGESAGTKDEKPRHDLQRPWEAIRRAAKLEGVRLHDLRHTNASIGVANGLGLPIVGALLGHAQASTTLKYAHLGADPVRRAADAVGADIAAAIGLRADPIDSETRGRA